MKTCPGTGKKRQIGVRLTDANQQLLDVYTAETHLSVNAAINEALAEFLHFWFEGSHDQRH